MARRQRTEAADGHKLNWQADGAMGQRVVCRMPFGKYKGSLMAEIPESYLIWLRTEARVRDGLLRAVNDELERRAEAARAFT